MKIKHLSIFTTICAAVMFGSCSQENEVKNEDNTEVYPLYRIDLTNQQHELVNTMIDFSYRMWDVVADESRNKNMLISPLSIYHSLSMLANGADGETLRQLNELLGTEDLAHLNELNKLLITELPKVDRSVKFTQANSIWIDNQFALNQNYLDACMDIFGAGAYNFEAGSNSAMDAINNWCSKHTDGMIPKYYNQPPTSNFILLNALYFNGKWKYPFDKGETKKSTFHNSDGSSSKVNMMYQKDLLVSSGQNDEAYVVDLPYGNSGYMMTIVMPKEGYTLQSINAREIISEALHSIPGPTKLELRMPRFSIEYTHDNLESTISKLGYPAILQSANISKMCAGIDDAQLAMRQKAIIEVNESGTKAAAVTDIDMVTGIVPILSGKLTIDRPFMFYISETVTRAVLFMGKVEKL